MDGWEEGKAPSYCRIPVNKGGFNYCTVGT